MSEARIYQPAKTAMQSGRANTQKWILEFAPGSAKVADPLMGWIGSADMDGQVKLRFATKEEAIQFAAKNGIAFQVVEPAHRRIVPKNYADNFSFSRIR